MKKPLLLNLIFSVVLFVSVSAANEEYYKDLKLFNEVLEQIEKNYVEEKTPQQLIKGAIKGMISMTDPYSQYLDTAAAKLMKEDTQGEFGGLGIRITIKDNFITVITPIPDTPAYRKGILPGDKIIKINGVSTENMDLYEAVKTMRGEPGTKVTITIARNSESFDMEIVRDKITIESVPKSQSKMLSDKIGYIKISEFIETTPEDFASAYKKLEDLEMKGLILDLRNNPGGLLNSAVEVTKHFLEKGQMIVYTKGRNPQSNFKFYATETKHKKIPLVVLVNDGSASGSEIVAGAIKDWGRGILLGEKTFGKGSVQSLISLSDGSQLRLTTSKYYTPKGICIHDEGIMPDIVVPVSREDKIKLMQQQEKIYGLSPEEEKKREKEKIPDTQIERAKELIYAQLKFLGEIAD